MSERCSTCKHFLARGINGSSRSPDEMTRLDGVGLCRRYPPRWLDDDELDGGGLFAFPAIHQDHRCGEYRPAREPMPW